MTSRSCVLIAIYEVFWLVLVSTDWLKIFQCVVQHQLFILSTCSLVYSHVLKSSTVYWISYICYLHLIDICEFQKWVYYIPLKVNPMNEDICAIKCHSHVIGQRVQARLNGVSSKSWKKSQNSRTRSKTSEWCNILWLQFSAALN